MATLKTTTTIPPAQFIAWVIYNKTTTDYPGNFVLRKFNWTTPEPEPVCVTPDLDYLLTFLPKELIDIGRQENDDPCILTVYL